MEELGALEKGGMDGGKLKKNSHHCEGQIDIMFLQATLLFCPLLTEDSTLE